MRKKIFLFNMKIYSIYHLILSYIINIPITIINEIEQTSKFKDNFKLFVLFP